MVILLAHIETRSGGEAKICFTFCLDLCRVIKQVRMSWEIISLATGTFNGHEVMESPTINIILHCSRVNNNKSILSQRVISSPTSFYYICPDLLIIYYHPVNGDVLAWTLFIYLFANCGGYFCSWRRRSRANYQVAPLHNKITSIV